MDIFDYNAQQDARQNAWNYRASGNEFHPALDQQDDVSLDGPGSLDDKLKKLRFLQGIQSLQRSPRQPGMPRAFTDEEQMQQTVSDPRYSQFAQQATSDFTGSPYMPNAAPRFSRIGNQVSINGQPQQAGLSDDAYDALYRQAGQPQQGPMPAQDPEMNRMRMLQGLQQRGLPGAVINQIAQYATGESNEKHDERVAKAVELQRKAQMDQADFGIKQQGDYRSEEDDIIKQLGANFPQIEATMGYHNVDQDYSGIPGGMHNALSYFVPGTPTVMPGIAGIPTPVTKQGHYAPIDPATSLRLYQLRKLRGIQDPSFWR